MNDRSTWLYQEFPVLPMLYPDFDERDKEKIRAFLMGTKAQNCFVPRDLIVPIAKLALDRSEKDTLLDLLRHELLVYRYTPSPSPSMFKWPHRPNRFVEQLELLIQLLSDESMAMIREDVTQYLPLCYDVNNNRMTADMGAYLLEAPIKGLTNRRARPDWQTRKAKHYDYKKGERVGFMGSDGIWSIF